MVVNHERLEMEWELTFPWPELSVHREMGAQQNATVLAMAGSQKAKVLGQGGDTWQWGIAEDEGGEECVPHFSMGEMWGRG